MAEFLESPRFPGCPSFGLISQPDYSVSIIQTRGGQETRNANWSRPLYNYQLTVGPRMQDEIQELLEFWHGVGGQWCGFRFKDPADYLSCRVGETPTAFDAPLIALGDSDGSYQLVKRYSAGARTQDRDIYKPVSGKIVVANHLGVVQASSRWSLDYSTGILVPNGMFVGTPGTWGGEFDVPVRFSSEFPVEITNLRIESVSFTLQELRQP